MTPAATTRRARALLVSLLTLVVMSACGSVVDAAGYEKELKAELPGLAESDMRVTSVTCPQDQEYAKGVTFDCDYTVEDGSEGTASVTITSVEGDGKSEYMISRYASGQMSRYLLQNTESDVPLSSVECPKTIKDGTVCTFEDDDGDTGTMNLAFDDQGNFESTPAFD